MVVPIASGGPARSTLARLANGGMTESTLAPIPNPAAIELTTTSVRKTLLVVGRVPTPKNADTRMTCGVAPNGESPVLGKTAAKLVADTVNAAAGTEIVTPP